MLGSIFFLALILGFVLVVRGCKGGRTGESPHCVQCNFDLAGTYPAIAQCPECAPDIQTDNAVATGRWRRRWKTCAVGIILILFGTTGSLLTAAGAFSTPSLIGHLRTGTLIKWSLRRPDSPIASEARWELVRRAAAHSLSATDQEAVLKPLLDNLDSPPLDSSQSANSLLSMLAYYGTTSIRQDIADFLIRRHAADNQPWHRDWGGLLGQLRADGSVSDQDWNACLSRAYAPKPWIAGSRSIRPGEEFVLSLRPPKRPFALNEPVGIAFELPEDFTPLTRLGTAWQGDTWVGALDMECPILIVRAPHTQGDFQITAHWVDQTAPSQSGQKPQDTSSMTGRTTISIRAATTEDNEDSAMARWLLLHLMPPAEGLNGKSLYGGGFSDPTPFAVATARSQFSAKGRLVLLSTTGSEQELCSFTVFMSGPEAVSTLRFAVGSHSSFSSYTADLPTFELHIPESVRSAPKDSHLLLRLDQLTLPDGRKHTGPNPIDVELQDALTPEPD